jgi:serine/threonine protein kinase
MADQKPDIDKTDKTLKANLPTEKYDVKLGTVDRYMILKRLGTGGFGAVFLARDTVADIAVALKVLPPEIAAVSEELENVRSNFALVSRLHHHNVAGLLYLHRIEKVDEIASQLLKAAKGEYLVVMEYIEGVTLSEWQKQFPGKKVPFDQAIHIMRQVAEALDYAHRQKIIHRDIKPANIMVQGDNTVKVLDFGLAYEIHSSMSRVTMEKGKASAGTPNYMSPEQWAGGRLTEACDQYALACMFYELISGSVPFASAFSTNDYRLMMHIIGNKECELLDGLPSTKNAAVRKAMNKDPKKRFESCNAFVDALQGIKPHSSKRGLWLSTAAAVVLLVAVIAFVANLKDKSAERQPEAALPKAAPEPEKKAEPGISGAELKPVAANSIRRARPVPGHNWTIPDSNDIQMIWIKPGSVKFIGPEQNISFASNPSGFWLSRTEVTVGQFMRFLRKTGITAGVDWSNPQCPLLMKDGKPALNRKIPGNSTDRPMTCINSRGVVLFCVWLNRRERKSGRLPLRHQYHIPGLDLFKYAFAAGGKSATITLDEANKMISGKYCWNRDNSGGKPHAVMTSAPDSLGFYDLTGNVSEIAVDAKSRRGIRVNFALFGTNWNEKLPDYKGLISDYFEDKVGPEVGFRVALGIMF